MAYNNGRENRKWLIWKEAEEKILREHGVDETTTPQIRTDGRADFNSNRRTLQIILLKMRGYSTKEIAPLVGLSDGPPERS